MSATLPVLSAQCLVLSTLVGTGVAATWLASGYDTIRWINAAAAAGAAGAGAGGAAAGAAAGVAVTGGCVVLYIDRSVVLLYTDDDG